MQLYLLYEIDGVASFISYVLVHPVDTSQASYS